jgi:hypothetical protein
MSPQMKVQFQKLITFRLCYVSENKFLYNSGTTIKFLTIQLQLYRSSSSSGLASRWISNGGLQWEWMCTLLLCVQRQLREVRVEDEVWETATSSVSIVRWHSQFTNTGCVINLSPGQGLPSVPENVKAVCQTFTRSPQKSTRRASR